MTTWRNRWDRGPLELIARDYLAGIPVKTISAIHRVSPRAIRRTVQQRGLPRRHPRAFGRPMTPTIIRARDAEGCG